MIGKLLGYNKSDTTPRYAHLARDSIKATLGACPRQHRHRHSRPNVQADPGLHLNGQTELGWVNDRNTSNPRL